MGIFSWAVPIGRHDISNPDRQPPDLLGGSHTLFFSYPLSYTVYLLFYQQQIHLQRLMAYSFISKIFCQPRFVLNRRCQLVLPYSTHSQMFEEGSV